MRIVTLLDNKVTSIEKGKSISYILTHNHYNTGINLTYETGINRINKQLALTYNTKQNQQMAFAYKTDINWQRALICINI